MREALTGPVVLTFLGVFVSLALAEVAAAVLERRGPSPTLANARARIRTWWVIVGALAAAFLAGQTATVLLFGLISFWCLRELLSLTPSRLEDHYVLAAAFYLFLPLQYALLLWPWLAVFVIAIPVYGFLLLPVLALGFGETDDFLPRVARTQWALMLAVYCLSHAPALMLLDFGGPGAQPFGVLAFLLLVTQASDVAQYLFGKTLGRTPLAPRISPSKTREGLLLGAGAATLLGGALHALTPFGFWGALAMAFVAAAAGALGGLVLSAVKRSLGAKDWGTLVNGHGGMLDRMDSLAFSAPLMFHLSNYFWAV